MLRMVLALAAMAMLLPAARGEAFMDASQFASDSIVIEGDEGFTQANGVVSGDGTQSSPFLIEGYQNLASIEIRNTSLHFIIRDVTLVGIQVWFPCEMPIQDIILFDSSNGTVDGVSNYNAIGISLERCRYIALRDSQFSLLAVNDSRGCDIERNRLWYSVGAIRISNSTEIAMVGNSISNYGLDGIVVSDSSEVTLSRNAIVSYAAGKSSIRNNSGMLLVNTTSSAVTDNQVENSHWGVRLVSCSGIEVVDNWLSENYIEFQDDNEGLNYFSERSGRIEWSIEKSVALSVVLLSEVLLAFYALRRGRLWKSQDSRSGPKRGNSSI
ncbi:MAG: right-handed parallel beta-helix repeat-containing protein [Candidatus Thermoplasmatota archaeon]|nr:right-handed parallel beta-helix repeat-containing protein [Candidatus Thermoplasmatota archaeon]